MARFGRGQPHAPLFLRGALAAAVVAAVGAPQIHVLDQARAARPITSRIVFLHGARSLVPDRLPRQITVVSALLERTATRPRGEVLFLRTAQAAPVVAAPAPQSHVVLQPRERALARGDVVLLRTPQAPVVVATAAPQSHIVGQPRERAIPRGDVTQLRAPTIVVVAMAAPKIHVVSLTGLRAQPALRHGLAVYERPSRTSLVPDRLPPQFHIVSLLAQRTPLPGRRADIIVLRTALAPVVAPSGPAPQSHVLLQPRERSIARGAILQLRASSIAAAAAARRIHVVSLVPERAALQVIRRAHILIVRPSRSSVVPDRLAPQIHVFLQRHGVPRTHVLLVRGGQPPPTGILESGYWKRLSSISLAVEVIEVDLTVAPHVVAFD